MAPGLAPFLFALAFAIFTVVYRSVGLPPPAEIADIAMGLYSEYGSLTLLVAAFVEGIFMINVYFPGSFVILLAVFLSNKNVHELGLIVVLCWTGFVLAGQLNYWIGKAGFYTALLRLGKKDVIDRMRCWMDKRGTMAIVVAAIHPNFLAVSQVCMGISQEGYKRNFTLSAISLAIWVPLWTIVFSFILKQVDFKDSNQAWYIVLVFLIWGVLLVLKDSVYKPLTRCSNGRS
ncbi:MAG: DedA family protein [Hassallia sp.]